MDTVDTVDTVTYREKEEIESKNRLLRDRLDKMTILFKKMTEQMGS